MRATPRLARPSSSLPPKPPPSPHIAYWLSSSDQVAGQLSLPCASRRCDAASKVTPVMRAVVPAAGGGGGGGLPAGGGSAAFCCAPEPEPQPALRSSAKANDIPRIFF